MVICMTASLVFNPGLLYVCISETMCDIFKKLCEWPLYIWHLIMLVNVDPPILLRTARQWDELSDRGVAHRPVGIVLP